MKRLRHPVRAIREPFGTAGLILACIALVLAMTGAAFAAAGLTGKQKKEVEKIAKKVAGKPGAPGAPGAVGPQGPAGAKGDTGAAGPNGTPGAPGSDGVSPVGTSFTGAKGGCAEGGVEYKGASTNFVCNGEVGERGPKGETGDPGEPGILHPGETLPSGATETGAWTVNGTTADTNGVYAAISFPIPLAANMDGAHVHDPAQEIKACREQFPELSQELERIQCEQDVEARCPAIETPFNPRAAPGQLCVYEIDSENAHFNEIRKPRSEEGASAGRSGALLKFTPTGVAFATGTFAVTAP